MHLESPKDKREREKREREPKGSRRARSSLAPLPSLRDSRPGQRAKPPLAPSLGAGSFWEKAPMDYIIPGKNLFVHLFFGILFGARLPRLQPRAAWGGVRPAVPVRLPLASACVRRAHCPTGRFFSILNSMLTAGDAPWIRRHREAAGGP